MDAVVDAVVACMWVWAIGAWCMSFYVAFASCEGLRWFSIRRNPLLIVGALGGALSVWRQPNGLHDVPCVSIVITCLGWTCYAALVTLQYGRFRLWGRHIVPVNAPILPLLVWCALTCSG